MRAMIASIDAQRASMAAGRLAARRRVGDDHPRRHARRPAVPRRREPPGLQLLAPDGEDPRVAHLQEPRRDCRPRRAASHRRRGRPRPRDLRRLHVPHAHGRPREPAARLPGHAPLLQPAPLGARRAAGRPRTAGALIPADPTVRHSTEEHFLVHLEAPEYRRRVDDPEFRPWIDLRAGGGGLRRHASSRGWTSGRIRRLAIHGDTKLDNFLFSTRTGRVKALVDLDTIMPHTLAGRLGRHGAVARQRRRREGARPLARARRHGRLPRGGARLPVDGARR